MDLVYLFVFCGLYWFGGLGDGTLPHSCFNSEDMLFTTSATSTTTTTTTTTNNNNNNNNNNKETIETKSILCPGDLYRRPVVGLNPPDPQQSVLVSWGVGNVLSSAFLRRFYPKYDSNVDLKAFVLRKNYNIVYNTSIRSINIDIMYMCIYIYVYI